MAVALALPRFVERLEFRAMASGAAARFVRDVVGCGFTEAVRGVWSHHRVVRDGKIANDHPDPPTPWNGNPRDV